jgi:lipopolysaccharide biosynthesis protein
MLANRRVRIPFCICFANESWTRAWEGHREEILIEQGHSPTDDREFLRSLVPYFRDERYIRVGDKPLLLVYQTRLFPDVRRTAEVWREEAWRQGVGELYLCRCESFFDFTDPVSIGFEAAYEFPPHSLGIPVREAPVDPAFDGTVFDYRSCLHHSLQAVSGRSLLSYKRFRGVMTGFDNSPKMRKGSWVFWGSTPALYQEWLTEALRDTVAHQNAEEQIVFVNAWNEWAEGAILEPCSRFGDGYLRATADALGGFAL